MIRNRPGGQSRIIERLFVPALMGLIAGLSAMPIEDFPLFGKGKLREIILQEPSEQLSKNMAVHVFDMVEDADGDVYILFSENTKLKEAKAAWGVEGGTNPQSIGPKFRVVKYRSDGVMLGTISPSLRKEGGFTSPHKLYVDSRGHLYIRDIDRINEFDQEMKFVRSIDFPFLYSPGRADFIIADGCAIIALVQEYTGKGMDSILLGFDISSGKKRLIERHEDTDYQVIKGPQGQTGFTRKGNEYSWRPVLRSFPGSTFGYMVSSEFKLRIYAFDGCLLDTIAFPEKSIPIGPEEKELLRISSDSPTSFKPFCKAFFTDEKGRIFIIRPKYYYSTKSGQSIDVFSREGKYLYQLEIARAPLSMARGAFLSLYQDYTNNRTILTRHKIEDYEQMKY